MNQFVTDTQLSPRLLGTKVGQQLEPEAQRISLLSPINPVIIQILMYLLQIKYAMMSIIFIRNGIIDFHLNDGIYRNYLSLGYLLDLVLMSLLLKIAITNSEHTRLSFVYKIIGYITIIFSTIEVAQLILSQWSIPLILPRDQSFVMVNLLIFGFYFIIKDQLVKQTDESGQIYGLSGSSLFLLFGFFFIFALIFLIPTKLHFDIWEMHGLMVIMILSYLVFVNLWISGPTEYMDRESMHYLTNLTVLAAIPLVFTGMLSLPYIDSNLHVQFLVFVGAPLFYFNLIGKYRGYIFRNRKLVQVAPMIVSRDLK